MEKILYKKSYQLNSFAPKKYDDLLGKRGIFSTIRVLGKEPKLILIDYHIENMNVALKKMNINFFISEKLILDFLQPTFNKLNNQDSLFRVAINSNTISLALRARPKYYKNFIGVFSFYKRPIPHIKSLYYKKIMKLINSIYLKKQEVILCNKGLILEGCTTNLICINNKKIYLPKEHYYKGCTISYLLKNTKRQIHKSNIAINNLNKYEEILLVGSGKGVARLSAIPEINWKSKSDLIYKEFVNLYKKIL